MARTKAIEPVEYQAAKASLQNATNTVGVFLKTAGYQVEVGTTDNRLRVSSDGGPYITVVFDMVRAAGHGRANGSWAGFGPRTLYRRGAMATIINPHPRTKPLFRGFFEDDGSHVEPSRGTAWDDLKTAVDRGIAFANQSNRVRREAEDAFRIVKTAVMAKPIHRDILVDGLDVRVDTVGKHPTIDIDCSAAQFAEVWDAARAIVYRMSKRCEGCGDALPFGSTSCPSCAQGTPKSSPVAQGMALRVLPRHKLTFDELDVLEGRG